MVMVGNRTRDIAVRDRNLLHRYRLTSKWALYISRTNEKWWNLVSTLKIFSTIFYQSLMNSNVLHISLTHFWVFTYKTLYLTLWDRSSKLMMKIYIPTMVSFISVAYNIKELKKKNIRYNVDMFHCGYPRNI